MGTGYPWTRTETEVEVDVSGVDGFESSPGGRVMAQDQQDIIIGKYLAMQLT